MKSAATCKLVIRQLFLEVQRGDDNEGALRRVVVEVKRSHILAEIRRLLEFLVRRDQQLPLDVFHFRGFKLELGLF